MSHALSILLLEDSEDDAQLIEHTLSAGGINFVARRVETREAFVEALEHSPPDLILVDFRLSGFDGHSALKLAAQRMPATPVIVVTGALPDNAAAGLLREGASDYILKDRLARLAPAVQAAMASASEKKARHTAEASLRSSELRYRRLFEEAQDGLAIIRADDGVVVDVNPYLASMVGYPADALVGKRFDTLDVFNDPAAIQAGFRRALAHKSILTRHRLLGSDGIALETEMVGTSYVADAVSFVQVSVRDVTRRVRAEESAQRAIRALTALSYCNKALIHATDEVPLLQEVCRIVVDEGGYRLARVGYAQDDAARTVRHMAHAGERGDSAALDGTWDDGPLGQGPPGSAIRTGAPHLLHDALADPAYEPWRAHAMALGYQSVLALPLASGGRTVGALTIYSADAAGFDQDERILLGELADDLAFGIATLRARIAHQRSIEQLQGSMESTIEALAGTLEMRDAYTAGHQHRVADLAAAIGRELHFSEHDIHGIHLAAQVHDLGKIQVPLEILTKPTKLTRLEYQMIMVHAQAGYEILKDIDFPWPLADMVRQHHERMDGSGYPQGLVGDAILPGARVIAVADTVEAMSFLRPYRAALGIDKALAEVESQRGRLYDTEAVDACLRLFREGRFAFEADHEVALAGDRKAGP